MRTNRTNYKNIFIFLGIIVIILVSISIFRFSVSESVVIDNDKLTKLVTKKNKEIKTFESTIESKDSIIISLKLRNKKIESIVEDSVNELKEQYASKTFKSNVNENSTYWYIYFETSEKRGYSIIKLDRWSLIDAVSVIRKELSLKDGFIGIQNYNQTTEYDYIKYKKDE